MVKDPRETLHTGTYKTVNTPEIVQVEKGINGLPLAVRRKCWQRIDAIEERWRLDDEWWRHKPVARLYYAIRLASEQKLVIYNDLTDGVWYRQSY
ncbi:hypothetical protein ACFLTP_07370 [Chloroflexota bacterium]